MKLNIVIGIIIKQGKILICKRPFHLCHGGQWEFPGGKVNQQEPLLLALQRELFEEIGITISKAHQFYSSEYQYPDKYVRFDCFLVTNFTGTPYPKENQPNIEWVDIESLPQYDFPDANYQIIEQLINLIAQAGEKLVVKHS